jgi:hypothetical protein
MATVAAVADVRTLRGYTVVQRVRVAVAAVIGATLLAGFWNAQAIDGFGRDVVAGSIVGDPAALGGTFSEHGLLFGFLFGAVAGLAATFTACNCVVFAMLPGLAAGPGVSSRRDALASLGLFSLAVVGIGALYGMFIGFLGPDGVAAYNTRPVRIAQASAIFTSLGLVMLAWGALELGFLEPLRRRTSATTRAFFAQTTTKAAMLGLLVGTFTIGRPFPVMRDFLTYAAAANSPLYGAGVMIVQAIGQIAVMVALFLVLVYGLGPKLSAWSQRRPEQVALVSAASLVAGGTFFVFYWGLARAFDIGRWGFRLGWY